MDRVLIFDPLHYGKYFPHRRLSTFIQGLVPYYHNSDDGKCAFSVNIKLYAVGTEMHIIVLNIALAKPSQIFPFLIKHFLRLATSFR